MVRQLRHNSDSAPTVRPTVRQQTVRQLSDSCPTVVRQFRQFRQFRQPGLNAALMNGFQGGSVGLQIDEDTFSYAHRALHTEPGRAYAASRALEASCGRWLRPELVHVMLRPEYRRRTETALLRVVFWTTRVRDVLLAW